MKDTRRHESLASAARRVHDARVLTAEAPRVRYRDALAFVEFRALLSASAISTCGSVVAAVALTVLVYERTRSPFLSSLTFALGFLPYVVSGLFLSSLVDRLPARRLLVGADLACAALVAPMAWSRTPIPALLGLLLLVSTVGSLANATRAGVVRAAVSDSAYVPRDRCSGSRRRRRRSAGTASADCCSSRSARSRCSSRTRCRSSSRDR
jgi:MFS family permease